MYIYLQHIPVGANWLNRGDKASLIGVSWSHQQHKNNFHKELVLALRAIQRHECRSYQRHTKTNQKQWRLRNLCPRVCKLGIKLHIVVLLWAKAVGSSVTGLMQKSTELSLSFFLWGGGGGPPVSNPSPCICTISLCRTSLTLPQRESETEQDQKCRRSL